MLLHSRRVGLLHRFVVPFHRARFASTSTVDAAELQHFRRFSRGREWTKETGELRGLHSFNRLRVPWIVSNLVQHAKVEQLARPLYGLQVVDIGTGGGLLASALCRLGARVVGVDADESAIQLARLCATNTMQADQLSRLTFQSQTVEELSEDASEKFDAVVASEVLEHVADLETFVASCAKLAKPGGRLFFTTINKTLLSRILAIWMAETHEWEKFVEPEHLRRLLLDAGCRPSHAYGIFYNPVLNEWMWSQLTLVNYAIAATKA